MQHMPDKEFDNLFRDKFKDAEIEPSVNLWANIEQQLEPKRKKVFPIYWAAAASVAVVLTSVMVFQKDTKLQLRGVGEVAVQTAAPKAEIPTIKVERFQTVESTVDADEAQRRFVASLSKTETIRTPVKASEKNISPEVQPNESNVHLPIKKQDPIMIAVLPTKEEPTQNQTSMATADVKSTDLQIGDNELQVNEKKGIRNVGDIVNFVVDKIDKRDKKLIRFNTDDDDNSSIVGINIGFLKLNKKHK